VSRILCKHCGAAVQHPQSHINRSLRQGRPLFCNLACSSASRRLVNPPTEAERKAAKKAYDAEYRLRNIEKRKAEKAAYYQRTRDPEKERELRAARMPQHVEYCRRPEYKAKKSAYDKERRLAEYGEFAETAALLEEVEREIRERATAYEVRVQQGYYTRNAQKRRRELWLSSNRKT
jgi:hypothetical protein